MTYGILKPKRKWTTRKSAKFGGKCTSPTGQSGTKYRKKHLRAYGMPGTPNGVCVKMKGAACSCGGCGA